MKVTEPPGVPTPEVDTTVATNVNFAAFPVPWLEGAITALFVVAVVTVKFPATKFGKS